MKRDSIANHLVIARANLTGHSLVIVLGIPAPVLPALNHMLFTWALALKDDVLAQMVEHTFLMLTALGLYAWGKRQNRSALGCAAAALWLAHPLIRVLGTTAYVDIAFTCFVFLGVYALRIFWDSGDALWWYLGIALLAMCAGVKLLGLFFLGIAFPLGLWVLVRPSLEGFSRTSAGQQPRDARQVKFRFAWKPLVLGWTLGLLILIPWYGFIAYHTGNPLWPAFAQYSTGIWGAPWVIKGANALLTSGFKQATIQNFLTLPADWIRYPERFNADFGKSLFPLIVAWPLAWIVALFDRSVRWWIFWALTYTVFWYLQAPLIRYWLPVLPMAGLALCESMQWILERIRKSASLHNGAWVAASILILLWSGYDTSKQIRDWGLPPATPAAREAFLGQLIGYLGVKYVNAHADNADTVCVLSAGWLNYYFHQRVIDLRGALYQNRKPTFRWPNDQLWTQWLDYQNVKWLFIYYKNPELNIPEQNPVINPFWPDYELVYGDHGIWIFRRKPVPGEVNPNESASIRERNGKASPTALPVTAAPPAYEGYVDSVDCDAITAWGWDMQRRNDPVKLDVYDGSALIASITAESFRQDLLSAGKGNGKHYVLWPIPVQLKDGKTHVIAVKFAGTALQLGASKAITCNVER